MPAIITHYLCGENSINSLKDENIKSLIREHRKVFNLGTQGPDIFFFSSINHICFHKTGQLMHNQSISECFNSVLEHAKNQDMAARKLLAAYILGFACHYALDCSTHPFIYYKSGFPRKGEHRTYKYKMYHHIFEKAIDILMLGKEYGISPWDISVQELIEVKQQESLIVGGMYQKLLQEVYNINTGIEDTEKGSTNMAHFYTYIRNKSSRRTKLLSMLDGRSQIAHLLQDFVYQKELSDEVDYFNDLHSSWCLPWNDKVVNTSSFHELFQHAVKETEGLYQVIYSCLFDNMGVDEALWHISNKSFSTGEDCRKTLEFKYYDCIFEQ